VMHKMEMACFGLHACSVSDKVGTGPSSKRMQCPIEVGGAKAGSSNKCGSEGMRRQRSTKISGFDEPIVT